MSRSLDKLKDKLKEIFQLDQADLDFGIYRIMNQKRDEITSFLENDLLPQVKAGFEKYQPADKAEIQKELDKLVETIKEAGMDPEQSPKVNELREKLKDSVDITALEDEVYTHLFNFFRRYYQEGDFISLRRYKEGVYAIPYEGEEVKLHWANNDQYYIKTTEYFRDYTFALPSGKKVHFKLVEADTEKNNIKASNGNDRRFILCDEIPLLEQDGELFIRFVFRPDEDKRKQKALNEKAIETVFASSGITDWMAELSQKRPTESNPERTILEKHITDYTTKNTFDFFIHKSLGKFLISELDFYIKNEIMYLDDIEDESAPRAEQYLSKIKVIRSIAHKIIAFLAQIEDFQKKLWLKKKFVVETNYCITLNRIPEKLYPEIIANDAQIEEWVKLFAIDELEGDTVSPAFSSPLTLAFLKANQFLVIDTKFFGVEFRDNLLASIENIDDNCDGLLFYSENFQALNLLQSQFNNKIDYIYIDPPYNTAASEIIYKNGYKHSSWLTLLFDRVDISRSLLCQCGALAVAIDDAESYRLQGLLDQYFGLPNHVGNIAIMHNPKGREQAYISDAHDYTLIYANDISKLSLNRLKLTPDEVINKYPKSDSIGRYRELPLRRRGTAPFREDRPYMYFPFIHNPENNEVSLISSDEYAKIYNGDIFDDEFVELLMAKYKDQGLQLILPIREDGRKGRWRWGYERCIKECKEGIFFVTGNKAPTIYHKDYVNDTVLPKSLWFDNRYDASTKGTNLLKNIIPNNPFDYPKSIFTVEDLIQIGSDKHGFILDYFAGSGTTGHAVINLNRADKGNRKYIMVEMGEHFDTVIKPRIQKVVYSEEWKKGKPLNRSTGISHCFKYIKLESYEDTLNNLELRKSQDQQELLETQEGFCESYKLSYMLDVESDNSNSLLNLDAFQDPFNYEMDISTGSAGESKVTKVDLVETFNYLIGLTVQYIDHIQGFRVIQGTNPKGDKVLIIWRDLKDKSNADLDEFFRKQEYNPRDMEFDLIYVNSDNNLENLRKDDETWKVRLIEEDFKRLMFETEEV